MRRFSLNIPRPISNNYRCLVGRIIRENITMIIGTVGVGGWVVAFGTVRWGSGQLLHCTSWWPIMGCLQRHNSTQLDVELSTRSQGELSPINERSDPVDSVCRSWRHKQKHDWLGCTLFNWVSWVELCRYKHPFRPHYVCCIILTEISAAWVTPKVCTGFGVDLNATLIVP